MPPGALAVGAARRPIEAQRGTRRTAIGGWSGREGPHVRALHVEDRRRRVELLEVEREIAERERGNQYRDDDRVEKIDPTPS